MFSANDRCLRSLSDDSIDEFSSDDKQSLCSTVESISDFEDELDRIIDSSQQYEADDLIKHQNLNKKWVTLPLLEDKNKHEKDEHIAFQDEGHRYWIKGKADNVVSTTGLIKRYFDEFDHDLIMRMIMRSERYWSDPEYKYFRKRSNEIIAIWQEIGSKAAAEGSYNHLQIELFYNGLVADFSKYELNTLFKAFDRDHMSLYEPFRTEMLMFNEKLLVTGSCDILFKNKRTKKLVLMDWKFVKKLDIKSSKKAKTPLEHLRDCNFVKYSMQLSIYRYILESEYGYEFEGQFLVILHKNQKKYKKVETEYLKHEVEVIFKLREAELYNNSNT
jgi:CRISPR/Cas system-associated exonuclease Cas4 (RecB family)